MVCSPELEIEPTSSDQGDGSSSECSPLERLREVTERLRRECPWDAEQTHRSLVTHLIEETGEVVDAIEAGTDADLCEELGDLLLQVYFHATIAAEHQRFDLDQVANGIADKLIARHPHVFADEAVPDDLATTWEERKRAEKSRSSSLQGIADSLSVIARASKVASRVRNHGVAVKLADRPISAEDAGEAIIEIVLRAQASGVDADQASRDALRRLEDRMRIAEASSGEAEA